DPTGCPTHWQRVPPLPPKGERVALVDKDGYGAMYRFKHAGSWYLVKFLPPFDGTVSVTDQQGGVRVLASLEEAGALLALLSKSTDTLTQEVKSPSLTAQMSVSAHTDAALTLEEEGDGYRVNPRVREVDNV
ncbi:MAG: hypothetical protein N2Z75_10635, partial [Meiothermus sp.]|nr:hypothetical protein [Meiothermus sp.]